MGAVCDQGCADRCGVVPIAVLLAVYFVVVALTGDPPGAPLT